VRAKNVEAWLLDVEAAMRTTIRRLIVRSLADYAQHPRTEWVQSWPGQVGIAVSLIVWTREVSAVLSSGRGAEGLKEVHKRWLEHIESLTQAIRAGSHSRSQQQALGAQVVIDVHARDVLAQMIAAGVSSEDDYLWLSQLRYYLDRPQDGEDANVSVRMVQTALIYGNEYLGNSGRLVITPLTDRCYLTLALALGMQLGGAPQGPAGTGKTETTKDLAKAAGRYCVVFNGSDTLDYLAIAKFFRGLIAEGAWACFDEFNRIDVEVLSVIAQQVMSIQRALQARVPRFIFEGAETPLDPSCGIFITMNPGYAGRVELPDNLKALFRPVSMVVPDFVMIAEILLISYGFSNAVQLAGKIVATFRLASEQLSL
jgi:dynein heavy chain